MRIAPDQILFSRRFLILKYTCDKFFYSVALYVNFFKFQILQTLLTCSRLLAQRLTRMFFRGMMKEEDVGSSPALKFFMLAKAEERPKYPPLGFSRYYYSNPIYTLEKRLRADRGSNLFFQGAA